MDSQATTNFIISLSTIFASAAAGPIGGPIIGAVALIVQFLALGGEDLDAMRAEFERLLEVRLAEFQDTALQNDITGLLRRLLAWSETADMEGSNPAATRDVIFREINEINNELNGLEDHFFNPAAGEHLDTAPLVLQFVILRFTVLASMARYPGQLLVDLAAERSRLILRAWEHFGRALPQAVSRRLALISDVRSGITESTLTNSIYFEDDGREIGARAVGFDYNPARGVRAAQFVSIVRLGYIQRVRRNIETVFLQELAQPLIEAFERIPFNIRQPLLLPQATFQPAITPLTAQGTTTRTTVRIESPGVPELVLPQVPITTSANSVRADFRGTAQVNLGIEGVPALLADVQFCGTRREHGNHVAGSFSAQLRFPDIFFRLVGRANGQLLEESLLYQGRFVFSAPR